MLKLRIEIYTNLFLLIFKLLRKSLKRLKKHEIKVITTRNFLFSFLNSTFFQNLFSYSNFQVSLNNYLIQTRLKTILDSVMVDLELKTFSKKRSLILAYNKELDYLKFVKFLVG